MNGLGYDEPTGTSAGNEKLYVTVKQ